MKNWWKECVAFLVIVLLMVGVGLSYEITKLRFGPFTYVISEPIPDIEKFQGQIQPMMVEDEFAIVFWEGSSGDQDQWATIWTLFERIPKEGVKGSIILIQVSTGVTTRDPNKMKTVIFVDEGLLKTGEASYFLTKVEKFEGMEAFIGKMKAKYAKKHKI